MADGEHHAKQLVFDRVRSKQSSATGAGVHSLLDDLDAVFARAQALGCVSQEDVHGVSGGSISVRPWSERSFYAEDKWRNPLCFVEAGTIYPG